MEDIDARLASMIADRDNARDAQGLFVELAAVVAAGAAETLGRQIEEIGILIAGTKGTYLRFIAPRKLCDLGTIPTTKRDSIAVSVFTRKHPEANNNVPMSRHVAFFESVKVAAKPQPIMKMITLPLFVDGVVIGVAQVSKKGGTLAEAGNDFTADDVRKATEYFDSKAGFLLAGRPESF